MYIPKKWSTAGMRALMIFRYMLVIPWAQCGKTDSGIGSGLSWSERGVCIQVLGYMTSEYFSDSETL